jgi:hypothetical protein
MGKVDKWQHSVLIRWTGPVPLNMEPPSMVMGVVAVPALKWQGGTGYAVILRPQSRVHRSEDRLRVGSSLMVKATVKK